jgi:hypothetical protein
LKRVIQISLLGFEIMKDGLNLAVMSTAILSSGLDLGGLVWEGNKRYVSIDEALVDANQAIADWLASN